MFVIQYNPKREMASKRRQCMTTHATAKAMMKTWDEKPCYETEGQPKLTRATVTFVYEGDIEGVSTIEYLMVYPTADSAMFIGLERVVGSLSDRSGTFVLQHAGTFEGGLAQTQTSVVPNTGTGDLRGLRGTGSGSSKHGESHQSIRL